MDSKFAGGTVLAHFLTDETGPRCGDFTFNEGDLLLLCSREINLNEQPAQMMVSHPKIPGLSWVIFFYQTGPNQYQPRIAYDFPSYLRGDCEVCIQFAGMHWLVKHKFEGSSWLTTSLAPKVMNERWVTLGTVKKVEVRINITKIWFKFPLFTACCHPLKTKKFVRQPDFTMPDHFADVQLVPADPSNRRLFAHKQVLAMNSPWFYERFRHATTLNTGDIGPIVSLPFDYDCVWNFLRFIYPNSDFIIDAQNVECLMDMGKEYQMPRIIRKCEKFLYKYMEGGSAVLAYYLGRKHELNSLQDAALLHLAEFNSSQLRARINLDMKGKSADTQEILLNDLCVRLSGAHS
ncbi:hypothetical protein AAHC03_09159 [Spirometra sp. Aus1]|nr:unnamed protein product [Spirometra erinaceieuropaei]